MPIVVLTAQSDTHDVVAGLEAGADDYLVKPIAAKELAARLRAHLRRQQAVAPALEPRLDTSVALPAIVVGPLELRPTAGEAYWHGALLSLTRTEFKILCELAAQPGELLSREVLLERVWGYDFGANSNSLEVYVGYLRRKTERDNSPRLIHTVRGVGYVLRDTPP